MHEDVSSSQLAQMPPHLWSQALERMAIVDKYLRHETPTNAEAEACAAELQVGVRTFYRLVAAIRAARTGKQSAPSQKGLQSPLHPLTAGVLDAVIEELGPNARDSDILAICRIRCAAGKIPAPSLSAMRTRTGRPPSRPDLRRRLCRDGDLVLDACPLALDVKSPDHSVHPAMLTALIHMKTGRILGHYLGSGDPDRRAVVATLLDALSLPRPRGARPTKSDKLCLVVTGGLGRLDEPTQKALRSAQIHMDAAASQGLKAGAGLTAALGRKLGKIPISPLGRRVSADTTTAVPLPKAQAVVAQLISARNDELQFDRLGGLQLLGDRRSASLRRAALQLLEGSI